MVADRGLDEPTQTAIGTFEDEHDIRRRPLDVFLDFQRVPLFTALGPKSAPHPQPFGPIPGSDLSDRHDHEILAAQPLRLHFFRIDNRPEAMLGTPHMKEPTRCAWSMGHPMMLRYHDTEWGVPLHEDRKLFEFLVLDGAQAGLSWQTVLLKRENYREAFDGFDPQKIARYTRRRVENLLQNPGVIRNRLKIESAVTNARSFLRVQDEFGSFDRYVWQFSGGRPRINRFKTLKQIPAKTSESDAMSKDLQRRGFKFVGSTICYAFMQAAGMVNDHVTSCYRYGEVQGVDC